MVRGFMCGLSPGAVPDARVTSGATDLAEVPDVAGELAVAANAILLDLRRIDGANADGLCEILQREFYGMVPAIIGFRDPFPKKIMRSVAIVADGAGVVRRLQPRIEMIVHDVTVRACLWPVGEVSEALRELEGVRTETKQETCCGCEHEGQTGSHPHLRYRTQMHVEAIPTRLRRT